MNQLILVERPEKRQMLKALSHDHLQDVDVMREPVQQSSGQRFNQRRRDAAVFFSGRLAKMSHLG